MRWAWRVRVGIFSGDVRHALRRLRRDPLFAAIAVTTLAVGIGATTALYSVLDSALVRALPFRDADGLVWVWGTFGRDRQIRGASWPEAMDWREQSRSFDDFTIYDAPDLTMATQGEARQVSAEVVSPGYFEMLGARPQLGRVLRPEDDVANSEPVVVLGHGLWQSMFGGDPDVVGKRVQVDGRPFTVVGVMRQTFLGLSFRAEAWTTLPALSPEVLPERGQRWLGVVVRLKPGVSVLAAQQDLDRVALHLEQQLPELNLDRRTRVIGLRDAYLSSTRSLLLILFGAVLFLLVIACVNVTNLQVVRGLARTHELSLRNALGGSRGQLVRQLLIEGVVLALVSAVLGAGLAFWGMQGLITLLPQGALPPFVNASMNARSMVFAGLAAVVCGVAATLAPALRATGGQLARNLVTGTRVAVRISGRDTGVRIQHALVSAECALAVVVLIGAGLLVRSFRELTRIDLGFQGRSVLAARVDLPPAQYNAAARLRFARSLLERLEGRAGITSAAVTSDAPLRGHSSAAILQREEFDREHIRYYRHSVSPGYFATLGVPLMAGRDFTVDDNTGSDPVAIASATLAQRLWPLEDPLGKRLRLGGGPGATLVTIVGVVGDVRQRALRANPGDAAEDPDVYFPFAQRTPASFDLLVGAASTPAVVLTGLRQDVAALGPALALYNAGTMASAIRSQTATDRFGSLLLTIFGGLSLALAAVGVYGVMAFFVGQRRREMAIRLALGATPGSVRALVFRQGAVMIGAGGAAGIAVALIATRLLTALLYNVRPTDGLTFVVSLVALLIAGIAAINAPARRALRVEPQAVLGNN